MSAADRIRDQIASNLAETYHSCPDSLVYAIDDEARPTDIKFDVEYDYHVNPGAFVVKTNKGNYKIEILVTEMLEAPQPEEPLAKVTVLYDEGEKGYFYAYEDGATGNLEAKDCRNG